MTANPLFVGGGDYHLQSGSPCIDKGTADQTPDDDLEGHVHSMVMPWAAL